VADARRVRVWAFLVAAGLLGGAVACTTSGPTTARTETAVVPLELTVTAMNTVTLTTTATAGMTETPTVMATNWTKPTETVTRTVTVEVETAVTEIGKG
jgi:hypothetical protein